MRSKVDQAEERMDGWMERAVSAESDSKCTINSDSSLSSLQRQQGGRGAEFSELRVLERARSAAPMFS